MRGVHERGYMRGVYERGVHERGYMRGGLHERGVHEGVHDRGYMRARGNLPLVWWLLHQTL